MIKEHELIQIATGNFRIDFIEAYALDCNEEIIGEGSAYVLMENGEIELTCIFNEFNKYILFKRMNVAEKEVFSKRLLYNSEARRFVRSSLGYG